MSDPSGVRLGSLVVGSHDPQRLADWYRAAFRPDADPGTVLHLDSDSRLIFDLSTEDISADSAEPGRILINPYVTDINALASRLTELEVTSPSTSCR
jgi:hypothetical protein